MIAISTTRAKWALLWTLAFTCIFAQSLTAANDEAGELPDTFKVLKFDGKCEVKSKDGRYGDVKAQEYPFGVTLKTGRLSFILVELSPGNTFQMLAGTTMMIDRSTNDPRLKRLRMKEGGVSLLLDKWPKDHRLEVETPSAICGAVGTRFVVSVEPVVQEGGKDRYARQSFNCLEGIIDLRSQFSFADATTTGAGLEAAAIPEQTSVAGYIHEGMQNTYVDLTVNRGALGFTFGGQQSFVTDAEQGITRFVCAFEKSEEDVDLIAMKVEAGAVTKRVSKIFGRSEHKISAIDRPVMIRKKELLAYNSQAAGSPVEDYIAAAREEGIMQAEIRHLMDNDGDKAIIQNKRTRLRAQADKASELREKLKTQRVLRGMRSLRHGNRRFRH